MSAYVVGWPGEMIIKAGIGTDRRADSWRARGADRIAVIASGDHDEERLENLLLSVLADYGQPLADRHEFPPASSLGGWTECYRFAHRGDYEEAASVCRSIAATWTEAAA